MCASLCRRESCPKNHIRFTKNRTGVQAKLILVHFKNDNIKGQQEIELAKGNVSIAGLLEQAVAYLTPSSRNQPSTLFFSSFGPGGGLPYKANYFTTVASKLLAFYGAKCTANTFRHMFVTAWKDFIASPTTQLNGFTAQQLQEIAASMMLNSPDAWSVSYDDSLLDRGVKTILAKWPQFQAFIYQQHLDSVTEEAFDPLTASLAELTLS